MDGFERWFGPQKHGAGASTAVEVRGSILGSCGASQAAGHVSSRPSRSD
jgi:hypothetical protein